MSKTLSLVRHSLNVVRIFSYCAAAITVLLACNPASAADSPAWRLFRKPDMPVQSLTLLFVDPKAADNSDRQKDFDLSAMGSPPCVSWIGQRAAWLIAQRGVETTFGGNFNGQAISSVMSNGDGRKFRLLLTPVNVSKGHDGIFAPTFASISYRVRLYAPDDSEAAVFESTTYLGNSGTSKFNDFFTLKLIGELTSAGLIPSVQQVRSDIVSIPVESCPALKK